MAGIACILLLYPAIHSLAASQVESEHLYLLAADLSKPDRSSSPVELYRITNDGKLIPIKIVLAVPPNQNQALLGVYSVHELDGELVIDSPHDLPNRVTFLSERPPFRLSSQSFNQERLPLSETSHMLTHDDKGDICDLWPLVSVEPTLDHDGKVLSFGATSLRSICLRPDGTTSQRKDDWQLYADIGWDGQPGGPSNPEMILARMQAHEIVPVAFGAPEIAIAASLFPVNEPVSTDRVIIKAASSKYLVVGIYPRDANGILHVLNKVTGRWSNLSVLGDSSEYRLFGDWLVASVQDARPASEVGSLSGQPIRESDDEDGVKGKYRIGRARRYLLRNTIGLYNLATGSRLISRTPEMDTEILTIRKDQSVIVRVQDSVYVADLGKTDLENFRLISRSPEISNVHWAFCSN